MELDLGEGGDVCGWKSRVLQKGEPRGDNIQVLTKAMHAEASALQCSPSSDSCAAKERSSAAQGSGNTVDKTLSTDTGAELGRAQGTLWVKRYPRTPEKS